MSKARDIASATPAPSTVSATELGYLDGVSSAIQTQLDGKASTTADIPKSLIDAKGDLIVGSAADTAARLAVGTNDYVLTADSAATNGVKWAALPASGASFAGVYLYNTGNTYSINNNTATRITFNAERYDVGGYATSGSTITIPSGKAGYYYVEGQFYWGQASTSWRQAVIRKNTSTSLAQMYVYEPASTAYPYVMASTVGYFDVGDTIELYGTQNSGGALSAYVYDPDAYLLAYFIGA